MQKGQVKQIGSNMGTPVYEHKYKFGGIIK